ncbi:PadR family transcriptional regulator [Rhodococcus sp. HNM0569]|uniref:PadR family transcriptional regulator n=1 Tax=Rhodococcus sp. HNM0569 TaxID=2716340 RepID=UPI00146F23E4|nr:PadR family transcriptional regulator [Rhodococcus sp. HNM0569]NLU81248.1 PadR family transcriptional regulator [Rhodococcus sp. HNM0569]
MEHFHAFHNEHSFHNEPFPSGAQSGPGVDPRQQRRGGPPRRGPGHGGPHGPGRGRPHGRGGGFGPEFGPGVDPRFGPRFGREFGRGRGRGGRGRRGDVRAAILVLLAESPMHGYELIQQITERSDGVWRPSPGSIYPALSQLEDEGLVVIEKVAGRKTARLTEAGETYVETNATELGTPWDEVRGGVPGRHHDLRALLGTLTGAVGQVAAVGSEDQLTRAAQVLTDARKSVYRILAEDESGTEDSGEAGDSDGAGPAAQS